MKISLTGIGLLSTALLCGQAWAAETDYAAGVKALPLQQENGTARAMAMGSAVVAVPQGSASLLWNPAGLSRMSCSEIGLHHNTGLADTIQEIAIFGMPLGEVNDDGKGGSLGGIAASAGFVDHGSFSGRDAAGVPTESYNAGNFSGSLGWGMELLPNFSGGVVLKGSRSDFAKRTYDSWSTDVGILWKMFPALDLGLVYTNINVGKEVAGSQLVSGWRLGAGLSLNRHWLLAVSGELQQQAMHRFQAGTEYLIGNLVEKYNVLALRAGYQINYPDAQLNGLTGLTFGLGYAITRSMTLDYAMLPTGELGASHRLSLTFKFGCPEKPQPPVVAAATPAAPAPPPPPPVVAVVAPMTVPYVAPPPPAPIVLKTILLEDSHFDFDKSTLKPEGMQTLRENIQILKDNPNTRVRIAGYTSMRGKAEYNQTLSERRAAAVEDFLITEGDILPGRITAVGFGETNPVAYEESASKKDSNSPAAKANMRVLFEVIVK